MSFHFHNKFHWTVFKWLCKIFWASRTKFLNFMKWSTLYLILMLIITGRENDYCYMTVFFSGVIMHLSFNQNSAMQLYPEKACGYTRLIFNKNNNNYKIRSRYEYRIGLPSNFKPIRWNIKNISKFPPLLWDKVKDCQYL